MLGKLAGKDEADGGLDLSGRDGGLLVVGSELAGLGGDTLENVCGLKLENAMGRHGVRVPTVDERVQDGHGTVGDTSVGVDLLEDCVNR